jgi:hypothetical protein
MKTKEKKRKERKKRGNKLFFMGLLHCPLGGHLLLRVPYNLSLLYTCSSLELPVSDRIYKKAFSSENKKKKRERETDIIYFSWNEIKIWDPPPRLASGPYTPLSWPAANHLSASLVQRVVGTFNYKVVPSENQQ